MTAARRRIIVWAIVLGYAVSLALPAVQTDAADTARMPGWMMLVFGGLFWWMVPTIGWFANLAVPTALVALRWRLPRWFGALSLLLTAATLVEAMRWSTIPTTTAKVEIVTRHYSGYYLWLAVILASAVVIGLQTAWRGQARSVS
ncbi:MULTISPECIES: hypothetical protein [Sphingomonas]|uniref:hypothetical protein n=1 Tax=Sphingomonas TaxID=13687 RepID=UPI000837257F|nr:hypothetical protein [Sphingomonas sp. CCH10-B3]